MVSFPKLILVSEIIVIDLHYKNYIKFQFWTVKGTLFAVEVSKITFVYLHIQTDFMFKQIQLRR